MDNSTEWGENVILIVNTECICRLCLRSEGALSDIFDKQIDPKIIENIALFANINIKPDDNLPLKICHRCRYMIESCCEFKSLILHSNKLLLQTISGENYTKSIMSDKSVDVKSENDLLPTRTEDDIRTSNDESNIDDGSIYNDDIDYEDSNRPRKKRRMLKRTTLKKSHDESEDFSDESEANSCTKTKSNKTTCLLCLQKCKDSLSLKKHIYMHIKDTDLEPYNILGESNITCKPCNKKFNYRYSFLDHQRYHLNLKPFPCLYNGCENAFSSKSLLRQHEAVHAERNYICATCAVSFKRKTELTAHEKIHEDENKRYECPICGFLCKTRFTRAAHLKNHKNIRKFKCSKCPKNFFSPSQLRTHELVHLPEKCFSCDKCASEYYSSSALARHLKVRHSIEWGQQKKQKIMLFDENLADADDANNDLFKFNNDSYEVHEISVNIDSNQEIESKDLPDFKNHKIAHINNSKKKLIKSNVDKPKECLLCMEKFKEYTDLFKHVDKHVEGTDLESYYMLGESNINCKCCGKDFNYRYNFLIHQREQLNLKPFKCISEGCSLYFHSKSSMRHHMGIHNEKRFICSVCSMGFKRKTDLTSHEIIHEDADIKYECPKCGLECKTRFTKAVHMKKHQIRPKFKCLSCPKEYFCKSHLLTHEIVHSSNDSMKPFPCNKCKSAYLSRKSLMRHKNEHHGINEDDDKKEDVECTLCKQTHVLISDEILNRHQLNPNHEEYSYRCDGCSNGFYEEQCFNKHIEFCLPDASTVSVDDKEAITLLPEQMSLDSFQI